MIKKSISILAILTLISRILGLFRSMLLANFLGTTFIADSFALAYKIPNLLRRLVGEGSMTAAFIPVFSDIRNEARFNKSKESFFLSKFYSLSIISLCIICIIGIIFTPLLLNFIYSFGDKSPSCAIFLTRYMFCYIAFISLAAITGAVLNSNFKFAITGSTPIALNIIIISSVFILKDWIPNSLVYYILPEHKILFQENLKVLSSFKAAFAFATGILVGGIIQFIMQLPTFLSIGYRLIFTLKFTQDPQIKRIGKLMIPGLFALGIYQINAIIADPFALAYLENGSIAALTYSNRLMEFTLGIFIISISTVILPTLSKNISENKLDDYASLVKKSVSTTIFISIPATFGLIILRDPLISLLFKSGLFSEKSVSLVSTALLYHALGLTIIGIYRIYSPAFYALKDTKTPVKGAFISLIVNIIFCSVLPIYLGIGGIALASTIAAFSNSFYLITKLQKKISALKYTFLLKPLMISILNSIIMSACILLLRELAFKELSSKTSYFLFISSAIFVGSFIYFSLAVIFKNNDLKPLLSKWK